MIVGKYVFRKICLRKMWFRKICYSANLVSENLLRKIWCQKICCWKNLLDPKKTYKKILCMKNNIQKCRTKINKVHKRVFCFSWISRTNYCDKIYPLHSFIFNSVVYLIKFECVFVRDRNEQYNECHSFV